MQYLMINLNTTSGLDPLQIARIKRTIRTVEGPPDAVPEFNELGDPYEWWGYAVNGIGARADAVFPVYPFTPPSSALVTDPVTHIQYYRRPAVSAWGAGSCQLYSVTFVADPANPVPSGPNFMPVEDWDRSTGLVTARMVTVFNWSLKAIPAKYFVKIEWHINHWRVSNADCTPVIT